MMYLSLLHPRSLLMWLPSNRLSLSFSHHAWVLFPFSFFFLPQAFWTFLDLRIALKTVLNNFASTMQTRDCRIISSLNFFRSVHNKMMNLSFFYIVNVKYEGPRRVCSCQNIRVKWRCQDELRISPEMQLALFKVSIELWKHNTPQHTTSINYRMNKLSSLEKESLSPPLTSQTTRLVALSQRAIASLTTFPCACDGFCTSFTQSNLLCQFHFFVLSTNPDPS